MLKEFGLSIKSENDEQDIAPEKKKRDSETEDEEEITTNRRLKIKSETARIIEEV